MTPSDYSAAFKAMDEESASKKAMDEEEASNKPPSKLPVAAQPKLPNNPEAKKRRVAKASSEAEEPSDHGSDTETSQLHVLSQVKLHAI
jgi:hypothetical protein